MIHRFKYRRQLTHGKALADQLAEYLAHTYDQQRELSLPELIVPVPLHWTRRWKRGFNQAEMLGRDLAQVMNIPLVTRLCRRTQDRKSTRLNSSHVAISYAVFCLK